MRKSGINSNTPNDFMLNAGVVFKNFKYVYKEYTGTETTNAKEIKLSQLSPKVSFVGLAKDYVPAVGDYVVGAWDDSEENVIGATNGGNKLSIIPEITPIEVDGAIVDVKGLTQKTGEVGTLEVNLAQHTEESFKMTIIGKEVESLIGGYKQIQTKSLIELSDYLDNIAFVGTKTNGKEIIVIMENVICTSGLELEGKNKETSVVKITFKASADFASGIFDTLPIYIFYPDEDAKTVQVYKVIEG